MPFFILSLILQIALVLHVVRTGRNTTWIWIVVMLPLAGSIAYLALEVMPEFLWSRSGRKATRKVSQLLNPDKDLKQALSDLEVSDTVENAMRLANECLNKKMYVEAKNLFQKSLVGVHKTDPVLMFGLAKAEFGLENYAAVKGTLDSLIQENPEFKDADAHLLYARSLEALGELAAAEHEYDVLNQYYVGPEVKYRYAQLCYKLGKQAFADQLLDEILKTAQRAGRHYGDLHREWISGAKKILNK